MSEVCVCLADGFEEIEGLTVVDLLRRAEIEVETVSIMEELEIIGSHRIPVKADKKFEEADFSETKMLVLPGGLEGTHNLNKHQGVRDLLLKFYEEDKYLAAICAAPTIFAKLGLLEGKRATAYPSMEKELVGAIVMQEQVVTDGKITTGRGMGGSIDFALRLIEILRDNNTAEKIAKQVVYERG